MENENRVHKSKWSQDLLKKERETAMQIENIDHTEYPKRLKNKSIEQLQFIIDDAKAAIKAMPDGPKAGYYADEICYCGDEITKRAKSPMTPKHFEQLVRVNVSNEDLSDKAFRDLMRMTLSV